MKCRLGLAWCKYLHMQRQRSEFAFQWELDGRQVDISEYNKQSNHIFSSSRICGEIASSYRKIRKHFTIESRDWKEPSSKQVFSGACILLGSSVDDFYIIYHND